MAPPLFKDFPNEALDIPILFSKALTAMPFESINCFILSKIIVKTKKIALIEKISSKSFCI